MNYRRDIGRALLGGREPAAWVGLIEGLLLVMLAFGVGIGQETFGPIMALVTALGGAYTAFATRDTVLGAILAVVKATLALVTVYGLDLSDQQAGAIIGLTSVLVGFWQRTQTSPVADPIDPSPTQVVQSPHDIHIHGEGGLDAAGGGLR